ncbi:MAG: hypothetical protein ABF780_03830 [Bifidobacterium aquikefiri]|uniref:hypothetical protein n=1 Tax=Bifidobacterium aquikefiri TaxID=1653207 RepID=UPI000B9A4F68|nr:hypothetical protein [Bifidobacterium aquikefiri]
MDRSLQFARGVSWGLLQCCLAKRTNSAAASISAERSFSDSSLLVAIPAIISVGMFTGSFSSLHKISDQSQLHTFQDSPERQTTRAMLLHIARPVN